MPPAQFSKDIVPLGFVAQHDPQAYADLVRTSASISVLTRECTALKRQLLAKGSAATQLPRDDTVEEKAAPTPQDTFGGHLLAEVPTILEVLHAKTKRLMLRGEVGAEAAHAVIRQQLRYVLTTQQQANRLMARKDVVQFDEAVVAKHALGACTLLDVNALAEQLDADIAAFEERERITEARRRSNPYNAYR